MRPQLMMAHLLAAARLRADFGGRARLNGACTFALGHAGLLDHDSATSRRHHPYPAEAERRWRGRGASRSGSVFLGTTHALFALKVQRKPRYRLFGSHRAFVW